VDDFLAASSLFVTNGEFLGLLTILFGVGLEIQYRSALQRGLTWPVRYLWRSVLLFFEGSLWEGQETVGGARSSIIWAIKLRKEGRNTCQKTTLSAHRRSSTPAPAR
jgi:hypothetical protein